jgi:hypothetical protein
MTGKIEHIDKALPEGASFKCLRNRLNPHESSHAAVLALGRMAQLA